jgi:hypothetical protein
MKGTQVVEKCVKFLKAQVKSTKEAKALLNLKIWHMMKQIYVNFSKIILIWTVQSKR